MRTRFFVLLSCIVVLVAGLPVEAAQQKAPPAIGTVPGQIKIVTVNARQNQVLGLKKFEDMFALSHAIRRRPVAWNGGVKRAVAAPDIVAVQEVRSSNAEIIEHLLRQRFKRKYMLAGFEDAASQIMYNPETVALDGDVVTWEDVCSDRSPGKRDDRFYQFARFTELASGAPFTIAAVHLPKNYSDEAGVNCYHENLEELRRQLAGEISSVFIAGDFNRRAVEQQHECDPNELSARAPWYEMFLEGEGAERTYRDAVRDFHRARGLPMTKQWTHEQRTRSTTCDGKSHFRRSRIDYIFYSGATVADASVDAPGWAGPEPGSKHPTNHKYSDHRYLAARFVLAGPDRPALPSLVHGRKGRVTVLWEPVEGATSYRIYRSLPGSPLDLLQSVDGTTTSFVDTFTAHDVTYKYSVAAIGSDTSQGQESRVARVTIDRRGPQITAHTPGPGATRVDQRARIKIHYSERIRGESVTQDRIRLFRGTKRLQGTVRQVASRVIIFTPAFPMWKGVTHRVVTKPVQDRYRNLGSATKFSFTIEPRKKKKRR